MKVFRRFAIFTTAATYFLIFLGGLVRVSGAGLGCPDWPKCFGRWFPPISYRHLPPEYDPNLFNITLAWIEFSYRLVGLLVGFLIAVLAVWAIARYRHTPKILLPSIIAALLVAFQGWQGGQVVLSDLAPFLVSVHLIIAFIIASLMVYIAQQAYYLEYRDTEKEAVYPGWIRNATRLLWLLVIGQVIFGTRMREALSLKIEQFPLASGAEIIAQIGFIKYLHPLLGTAIVILTLIISYSILKKSRTPSPLAWQTAWTLVGLALLQIVFGIVMSFFGLPDVIQTLHLWIAGLTSGMVLIALAAVTRQKER
ncbi:MAG: COX15/CtaA family protein [candidate division Zixibacteria bacterium]|nr:COX15/CtaA family protein [candidate division Zixibacteria bacterium]